jgi:hypothetical protein
MKYREAYAIGSKCEGVIKCTFATIYNKDGKGLFSLQNVKASYGVDYKHGGYSDESKAEDMIITQLSPNIYFADAGYHGVTAGDAEIRGGVTVKFPVVQIDRISNDRLVPAKLTDYAVRIIAEACKNVKVYKWHIYRVWDAEDTPGAKVVHIMDTYTKPKDIDWMPTDKYHYEYEAEKVINPRYEQLISILQSGDMVYIKPDAFDWEATDLNNATIAQKDENGNEIQVNLNDAIEAARKRMETAKAILATAATLTII